MTSVEIQTISVIDCQGQDSIQLLIIIKSYNSIKWLWRILKSKRTCLNRLVPVFRKSSISEIKEYQVRGFIKQLITKVLYMQQKAGLEQACWRNLEQWRQWLTEFNFKQLVWDTQFIINSDPGDKSQHRAHHFKNIHQSRSRQQRNQLRYLYNP